MSIVNRVDSSTSGLLLCCRVPVVEVRHGRARRHAWRRAATIDCRAPKLRLPDGRVLGDSGPRGARCAYSNPDRTAQPTTGRKRLCGFPPLHHVEARGDEILGHIMFSPMILTGHEEMRIMGLAPMAVAGVAAARHRYCPRSRKSRQLSRARRRYRGGCRPSRLLPTIWLRAASRFGLRRPKPGETLDSLVEGLCGRTRVCSQNSRGSSGCRRATCPKRPHAPRKLWNRCDH